MGRKVNESALFGSSTAQACCAWSVVGGWSATQPTLSEGWVAGFRFAASTLHIFWIPACAGMTSGLPIECLLLSFLRKQESTTGQDKGPTIRAAPRSTNPDGFV